MFESLLCYISVRHQNCSDYEIEIVNCILLTAGITIRDSSSEL
jgi:hypothetical protein